MSKKREAAEKLLVISPTGHPVNAWFGGHFLDTKTSNLYHGSFL